MFALDAGTGTQLWEMKLRHEGPGHGFIKALALTPPQDRLVAADGDGCLRVLDLEAKGQEKYSVKLGAGLERLCIAGWQGQTVAFATVRQDGAWVVRIWDLDRRAEVPTRSAYQLKFGEEDKPMRGLAVAPRATGVRLAFASKYGKVMVAGLRGYGAKPDSPWAYDEWQIPDNDDEYVDALAASPGGADLRGADLGGAGHKLLLAAATERGTLAIWDFLDGTLLARRPRAHLDHIRAMQFGDRAGQPALATGGDDGVLRIWTTRLDGLFKIEIDEPIEALTFLGADRIAVGGPRGVLMLRLLPGFAACASWPSRAACPGRPPRIRSRPLSPLAPRIRSRPPHVAVSCTPVRPASATAPRWKGCVRPQPSRPPLTSIPAPCTPRYQPAQGDLGTFGLRGAFGTPSTCRSPRRKTC